MASVDFQMFVAEASAESLYKKSKSLVAFAEATIKLLNNTQCPEKKFAQKSTTGT